tara:strand:+ start:463 stop:723 length:261 start_codon:yes stop_codon:yes gene_type:complete
MPNIIFIPILYAGLLYFFLGIFGVIGFLLGLLQTNTSAEPVPPKTKKAPSAEDIDGESYPTPKHRYNLRSRKGPKHRPAFGGLVEI